MKYTMKIGPNKLILLVILCGCILLEGCSRFNGYRKSEHGLYYKFFTDKGGQKPDTGQIAQIHLTYSFGDSLMFNSNTLKEPMNLIVNKPGFNGDINHALMMMGVGDSASFIIRADSFFIQTLKYNRLPRNVTRETYVTLNIGLKKIWTREEQRKQEEDWIASRKVAEREEIRRFMEENHYKSDTTPEGLYFRENKTGTGPLPKNGDRIILKFSVALLNGTQIFSSWDKGLPMTIEFGRKFDTEGINIAIARMRKGSVARLIIPSKLAFGGQGRPGFIPPYAPLLYDVEIVDIVTPEAIEKEKQKQLADLREKEQKEIIDYLTKNKITARPLPSGLFYIETRSGKGIPPKAQQTVKVHYTGYLLNGKKFDSSLDREKPFEFILGAGKVIKGWDEGIALMKPGSKAKLIIPSHLAYGERGNQPSIPPYAPLVFDVELISYE